MKLQNNYQISFKSGLTPAIESAVNSINTRTFERALAKDFGIDAKFDGNKAVAGCFEYVLHLCEEACEKYKLPFCYVPPSIRLYKPENVVDEISKDTNGFCIPEKQKVLKDEGLFDTGSIFIKELPDNINSIDLIQEEKRNTKHSSTSHFLALFFHEWFHNVHLNLLYDRFNKNKMSQIEQVRILNKSSQRYDFIHRMAINYSVSHYASTNALELFSEIMSVLMAKAIDSESMTLKNNPLDGLAKFPRFIQKYIDKELK